MMELSKHLQRKQDATCHMRNKAYLALPAGERLATSKPRFSKSIAASVRGDAAALDANYCSFATASVGG
jgi:hypothetical protein